MATDVGRAPSGQALVASDGAATHLHPPGIDPSRIVKVEFIQPTITVESVDRDGLCTGDKYIWVRHDGRPHLDALLATVHYNYAYHDNCTIGGVAERVAVVIGGHDPAIAMEAATAGETEGLDPKDDSAGPQDIAQTGSGDS